MAEFKISRFRYTWKGNWQTATLYIKDDVVRYSGSTWVCIRKHTSSAFNSDYTFIPEGDTIAQPAWVKMTEGYAWKGSWNSTTLYEPGELVLYGGRVYLATESHTSTASFEQNIAKWAVFVDNINWRSDWQQNTNYGIGDVVRYNGIVYICIEGHTSEIDVNGLEHDSEKWEVYFENVQYRGTYQSSTAFKKNDLAFYNGSILRCNLTYTSTSTFDPTKWDVEFPGNEFESDWDSETYYGTGSVVRYGGWLYYCMRASYGEAPIFSIYQATDMVMPWKIINEGINFLGTFNPAVYYKTGDVVKRGGNLYVILTDTIEDDSSLAYLDSSNWELLSSGFNDRGSWNQNLTYSLNDTVTFKGALYKALIEHDSDDQNFPSNGSGYDYWQLLIDKVTEIGMSKLGDLLTYDLVADEFGDQSTFGQAALEKGLSGQVLSSGASGSLEYRNFAVLARTFYVAPSGIDDTIDPIRGTTPLYPFKTVRFACEVADDGFAGFTTVSVATGLYEEILPIIVPARTVVLGDELRSTTIKAAGAVSELSSDSPYTIAALNRISAILEDVITGVEITPTTGNTETQDLRPNVTVISQVSYDPPIFDFETGQEILQTISTVVNRRGTLDTASDVQDLIQDIVDYINFNVNSTGSNPTLTGTNTAVTTEAYTNTRDILEANKEFLAAEAVAFIRTQYPLYNFDSELCKRDVRKYIDAWKYDIIYTGNYKSILAARYYSNAILGSAEEDMFYLRDSTGIRNCTLTGLSGVLNPPNVFDLYRRPTGASFTSLDPGWGPADNRTWITSRSPYVQGVTNIGEGCVGMKIDGSLHNGGNRSMVANDYTQVLSDGVGAWVQYNGRAELVSVFTYYCQVGYLAEDGGIIRSANGNNSYGKFGAISDGIDNTEIPKTAILNNRNQHAVVAQAFAGEVNDEILLLEWRHAGEKYTEASASILGSGANVSVEFEDFRDNAVFQVRLTDTSTNPAVERVGGGGYTLAGNNAQVSTPSSIDQTGITIASNDSAEEAEYLGLRIIITSGVGTGQYGYITSYNTSTKVVTVARESDDQPGWDHVIPGTPSQTFLTSTTYRIEPRPIFSPPAFIATSGVFEESAAWSAIEYGETYVTFTAVSGSAGEGVVVEDDGLEAITATWNVIKSGRNYTVSLNNPGAGYAVDQTVTILGTALGGATPENDITITVTATTDDSTNSIVSFTADGVGKSGTFVALSQGGSRAAYSEDNGTNWNLFDMPSSGTWKDIATGNNRFVAIKQSSNEAAYSLNGRTWIASTMPASREWQAVVYGQEKFVAIASDLNSAAYSTNGSTWTSVTLPTFGDSTLNEWVDITYGKGKFVVIANSNNICATSEDGITWEGHIMDVIADSTSRDWVSVAYGNNRYVAISSTGDIAYSFNGTLWYPGTMPTQDGSTAHNWKKIKYAQGVFFAIGDIGGRLISGDVQPTDVTTFAATSEDGILWTPRTLASDRLWTDIAFGNPYVDSEDSSVGTSTPTWIAVASSTSTFNKIKVGATAKGRVITQSGIISEIRLWDPGSGYIEPPSLTIVDPNNTTDAGLDVRIGDGVLTNPSWLNRGIAYRTSTTTVTISGNGYADIYPVGRYITLGNISILPSPGAQFTFSGDSERYVAVTIEQITPNDSNFETSAYIRVSPEIKTRSNFEHGTEVEIREIYSQCRISGHDFLDIGTGNFLETNYPELYSTGLYTPAPENEVVEEQGGRVFYTSTDQTGNFRAGELFAVEQSTGIVTISADFFDLQGLSELALGGVRLGGSGAVIREFSTDPLFTEDSNNIIPTQAAIKAYLANRLTVGGSEIATSSFIAGTVRVGPTFIGNTAGLKVVIPKRARFEGPDCHISGSILAQTMFYKSFGFDS